MVVHMGPGREIRQRIHGRRRAAVGSQLYMFTEVCDSIVRASELGHKTLRAIYTLCLS